MKPISLFATLGLGASLVLAATVSPAAAPKTAHAPLPKMASGSVAHGKALAASLRCNTCHAANLGGKKGFSPSLRASGVLREYNTKTWARVMDTGVTNDNGHVKAPMPVYHLKAADSNALLAYCKTLK